MVAHYRQHGHLSILPAAIQEKCTTKISLCASVKGVPHRVSNFRWVMACRARQVSRNAYFLTANTPSPFSFAAKPACCSRFATSLGTFRPLVSLLGVPV